MKPHRVRHAVREEPRLGQPRDRVLRLGTAIARTGEQTTIEPPVQVLDLNDR
jgi:hypothetical protein